ncbi:hypothetical protein [Alteraurantiacibacter palmitatis]|uniref:Peptidase S1 n=1 Tax=Alteraurantiacibacter palmitatis TaxID=2054628 RepID=A0ABV7E199_9SPHN
MRFLIAAALVPALGVFAVPTAAQDVSATPNFGTLNLSAGFTPDPRTVSVTSGGSLSASDVGSGCAGSISNAPDVRLSYSAGSLPLIISVNSNSDTTLVINAPDGRWYCDDDSGEGTNPSVRFNSPQSGRYEIWVGSYGGGSAQAMLAISEVGSQ